MQLVRPSLNLGKVLRFLDKPSMWLLYFIIAMYSIFFATFALRGIVQYNRVLTIAEKSPVIDTAQINKALSDKGFSITWGTSPTIKDFFKAGFKN